VNWPNLHCSPNQYKPICNAVGHELKTSYLSWFHRLPDNLKGTLFLMLASILFTLMALIIKVLGQNLNITQILLVRQLGMIVMVLPTIMRHFPGSLRSNRPSLQISRIGFAIIAMLGGFSAVIHLPMADATAIFFAKSFFITIFAVWFLDEVVGVYRWSAVAMGFVGVMVMLQPGTAEFSIYSIAALVGSAGAAGVMIILRILTQKDSADTIMAWSALGISIAMAIPGLYFWQQPTTVEWGLLAVLAVVSYFGQRCNIFAYKHGEASLLASLDYVRLLWATLLGYLVFGHFPGVSTWVGAGIVISAAIFVIYRETRRGKKRIDVVSDS
jgi:drug/metabolite transporter (DMT)-like permease